MTCHRATRYPTILRTIHCEPVLKDSNSCRLKLNIVGRKNTSRLAEFNIKAVTNTAGLIGERQISYTTYEKGYERRLGAHTDTSLCRAAQRTSTRSVATVMTIQPPPHREA
ncbi:hypothetical protein T07_9798 [Trichinella nelsoni]|uniref:Uncharacterized protein n=1 Tax=Trichinella nelsoni TaxID=6336 RepID=A0A0V0SKR6_9BILA|nr:hypothetical protein T07_9798 [Trichinella nelsoni]